MTPDETPDDDYEFGDYDPDDAFDAEDEDDDGE